MASEGRVSRATVQKAVNALLKWKMKLQSSDQNTQPQLFEEDGDDFIYLLLTLKKIPPINLKKKNSNNNNSSIPLPHPLQSYSAYSQFCLIIDDRHKPRSNPKSKSSKMSVDDAQKKIKSEDIPIAKVLKLSKLKSDYRTFEAKRKLSDSYDMFFADRRVVSLLPKLLGKQFFQKKKQKIPVPVDLTQRNWKEEVERACSSAQLCLSTTGTCSVVRVAKGSMDSGEIVNNVIAAIDGIAEVVPRRWDEVRSFHLKFTESLALPVYQAVPDM